MKMKDKISEQHTRFVKDSAVYISLRLSDTWRLLLPAGVITHSISRTAFAC